MSPGPGSAPAEWRVDEAAFHLGCCPGGRAKDPDSGDGRNRGKDKLGVWDPHIHTAPRQHKTESQQRPTAWYRKIDPIFYNHLAGERIRNRIYVHLNYSAIHLKPTHWSPGEPQAWSPAPPLPRSSGATPGRALCPPTPARNGLNNRAHVLSQNDRWARGLAHRAARPGSAT